MIQQIDGRVSWEQLVEDGTSAADASAKMHCSRRTALKSLKAAAGRLQMRAERSKQAHDVSLLEIGTAGERSNWPQAFIELAEKIDREGDQAVSGADRRMTLRGVPRTITIAR